MKIGPKILLPAIVLLAGIVATTAVVVVRPTASAVTREERAPLVHVVPAEPVTARLAAGEAGPEAIADELFLRCLGRPATDAERVAVAAAFADADRRAAVEEWERLRGGVSTWYALTSLRFQQDTRDAAARTARERADAGDPATARRMHNQALGVCE